MKKFLSLLSVIMIAAVLFTGCGLGGNKNNSADEKEETAQTDVKSDSGKKEEKEEVEEEEIGPIDYEHIDAQTKPVGVSDVKLYSNSGNYTYISGRLYKNSASPKSSYISATFEIFDETGKRLGKTTQKSDKPLSKGESYRFDEDLIWELDSSHNKNVSDDVLAAWTVQIIDVNEEDEGDAAIEDGVDDIYDMIEKGRFETAQSMIDMLSQAKPI